MHFKSLTGIELVAALLIGVVLLAVSIPMLLRARYLPRPDCQANLKQMYLAFKMYAEESEGGFWPPMHGDEIYGADTNCPFCLHQNDDFDYFADMNEIYPEYLSSLEPLLCPEDSESKATLNNALGVVADDGSGKCPSVCLGQITNSDQSYGYLGWALDQADDDDPGMDARLFGYPSGPEVNAQVAALFAYLSLGDGGAPVLGDHSTDSPLTPENDDNERLLAMDIDVSKIPVLGSKFGPLDLGTGGSGDTILRLRSGIEHMISGDSAAPDSGARILASIPVAWDLMQENAGGSILMFNHMPGGSNVLYMDGHVEFAAYPGAFPTFQHCALLAPSF